MTSQFPFLLLLVSVGVKAQELATRANLLGPRNFNHHAFDAKQFLQSLKQPEPTKQGPVLFPNDAPPPPRPPLIVTSRPLIESLARSELNPFPTNNTLAEQSQINGVTYRPEFLGRVKGYKPFAYSLPPVEPTSGFSYDFGSSPMPYADVSTQRVGLGRDAEYEEQSPLPPVYKAISEHTKQNAQQHNPKGYQPIDYQGDDVHDDGSNREQNQGQNYAFSYTVKDRKTGDDFSHSQHSSGSATNGEYRVRLPDGRMQIVSYTADENGYKADVRYDEKDDATDNTIDNRYDNNHNRYDDNNNNHKEYNNNAHDYKDNHHNDHDQLKEFQPHNDNVENTNVKDLIKDDYYNNQYSDLSKEYYNDDYSLEYRDRNSNNKYEPHKSKFNFVNSKKNNPNLGVAVVPNYNDVINYATPSTVKPSYEELNDIFVTKNPYNAIRPTPNYLYSKIPIELNVPSTTPNFINYNAPTTERVVIIGTTKKPNLYTDIRNSIPSLAVTPAPISYSTPMDYLLSTVSSFTNNVNLSGPKPVLSKSYINRINKYLSFK